MEKESPEDRAIRDVRNLRRRHRAYVLRVNKRRSSGDTTITAPRELKGFVDGKIVEDTFGQGAERPIRVKNRPTGETRAMSLHQQQLLAVRSTAFLVNETPEYQARYRKAYAQELGRWVNLDVSIHDAISSSREKEEQKSLRAYTHRKSFVQQQLDR